MPAALIVPPQDTPVTDPIAAPLVSTDWYMLWYDLTQVVLSIINAGIVTTIFGQSGAVVQEILTALGSATIASPQTIPFAEADVTGATITLDKNGIYKIDACVSMIGDTSTGQTIVKLNYNGTNKTDMIIEANVTSAAGTFNGTYSAHWVIKNNGSAVAKLRCVKGANASTAQITGARITAQFCG